MRKGAFFFWGGGGGGVAFGMELRLGKMICEIHLPENRDEQKANFVVAYGDSGGADHFSSDKNR